MGDAGAAARPVARAVRAAPAPVWDRPVTMVLLIAALIIDGLCAVSGVFIGFVSDACGQGCRYGWISVGVVIGIGGPSAAAVAGILVAGVRIARSRRAVWVPPLSAAAAVLLLLVGEGLARLALR